MASEKLNSKAELDTQSLPKDEFLVDWLGEDDPENPLNWTSRKKGTNVALFSALCFLTPLASSMFAPGVPGVLADFKSDSVILASFVVSIYLVGYAAGPLLCAPLSEVYGRLPVYVVTNIFFLAFTIACAVAPSLGSLIGFRFLAGTAGSAPLVLGGGSVADLYPREERGGKMAIFAMGPLMGPVIGPIAGAFLAEKEGWRWVFWVISIASGVVTVLYPFLGSETYPSVILEKKAAKLRKDTSNPAYHSAMASSSASASSPGQLLVLALVRPVKMFFKSPQVFAFSVYVSVIYGYLYLLFTTITEVYEQIYGFSTGLAGLSYLGIGIGMFLGLGIFGVISDKMIQRAKSKGEDPPPEIRLRGLVAPALCLPIGLFWYGWSTDKRIHWIMPEIGCAWFGLGMIGIFLSVQTYLVDCYPRYAASVTAANTVFRSLVGAFLPLAGRPLYSKLGLGWGNSLLGFLALAMAPLPFFFMRWGAYLRSERFQIKLD